MEKENGNRKWKLLFRGFPKLRVLFSGFGLLRLLCALNLLRRRILRCYRSCEDGWSTLDPRIRGYIGIMENPMKLPWYIKIMETEMETTTQYIGTMDNYMETAVVYCIHYEPLRGHFRLRREERPDLLFFVIISTFIIIIIMIWGFPKIRAPFFGCTYNKDYSIFGLYRALRILGSYHV